MQKATGSKARCRRNSWSSCSATTRSPRHLVWRDGLPQWQPLRTVVDELGLIVPALDAAAPPVEPEPEPAAPPPPQPPVLPPSTPYATSAAASAAPSALPTPKKKLSGCALTAIIGGGLLLVLVPIVAIPPPSRCPPTTTTPFAPRSPAQ